MALEKIGLQAVFEDAAFMAGVGRYVAALQRADSGMATTQSGSSALGHIMETAIGSAIGFLTATAIPALINGFADIGKSIIGMSADYETTMSLIAGLTSTTTEQMGYLNEAVLNMAGDFPQSAQELAQALYFISSSGYQGADAMNVLQASAKAAAGGLGDTKIIADLITSALNAYGGSSADATKYVDILTAAVREGKGEPSAFAASLGQVLPIAAAANVSFEQVAASIATMTRSGLSVPEAVTALRGTLSALIAPGQAARDALAAIGLTADDVRKSLKEKGLLATLDDLKTRAGASFSYVTTLTDEQKKSIDKLTDAYSNQQVQMSIYQQELARLIAKHGSDSLEVQKKQFVIDKLTESMSANQAEVAAMNAGVGQTVTGQNNMLDTLDTIIPNIRALTGVLATSVSQGDSYAATLDAMTNSTGATDKAFAEAGTTWDFQTKQLKNNFDIIKLAVGGPLLEALKPTIQEFTKFISTLSETGQIKAFADTLAGSVGQILPTIQKIVSAFQKGGVSGLVGMLNLPPDVMTTFAALQNMFDTLGTWWTANGPAIQKQVADTFGMLGEKSAKIGKELLPFLNEQIAKFSTWWTENGPLITEYITTNAKDFGTFAGAVLDAWTVIKPALDSLVTVILDVITLVMQIRTGKWSEVWGSYAKLVSDCWAGIGNTILAFGNWVASWVGSSLDKIVKEWTANWVMLKTIVSAVGKNIIKAVSDWITGILKTVIDGFFSVLNSVKAAWKSIGTALNTVLDAIDKTVTGTLEDIKKTLLAAWNWIFLSTETKWKIISSTIKGVLNQIQTNVSDGLNALWIFISGVWDAIIDTATTAWNTLVTTIINLIMSIPGAVATAVSQLTSIGTSIVNAITSGINNIWFAVGGVVSVLTGLLTNLITYIFSGALFSDLGNIGKSIIFAISAGLNTFWTTAGNIVSTLAGLLGNLVASLWSGDLGTKIQAAGRNIIDNIISGIQANWTRFVEWLRTAIAGIFGGGSQSQNFMGGAAQMPSGMLSAQGGVTQYSRISQISNTFNLYVSSLAPVSTVVQDFGTLQALAAV
jgi:TP901 family phage tail tape measure protein